MCESNGNAYDHPYDSTMMKHHSMLVWSEGGMLMRAIYAGIVNDSMARLTQNTPIAYRSFMFPSFVSTVSPPSSIGLEGRKCEEIKLVPIVVSS